MSVNDFAKLLKPKLHKQATILLHSCCVGEGGPTKINLASKLAHYLPGHCIFGSDKPISRGDLILTLAEEDIQKGILNIDYLIDPKRDYEIYKFINNSKNHHKGGGEYQVSNKDSQRKMAPLRFIVTKKKFKRFAYNFPMYLWPLRSCLFDCHRLETIF